MTNENFKYKLTYIYNNKPELAYFNNIPMLIKKLNQLSQYNIKFTLTKLN